MSAQEESAAPVAVIGAGSWGTALAQLLATKGHVVTLWVRTPQLAEHITRTRENTPYLPNVLLHPRVLPTAEVAEIASVAQTCLSAVPSHAMRSVWGVLGPLLPPGARIISATKGIEPGTLYTMSQVLHTVLAPRRDIDLAVLSGPTFARELSQGTPTAAVVAAASSAVAESVQQLLSTSIFRVYTNADMLGVEIGGALKNVMALAAGVCDGLHLGYNTRAALITRGLAEMTSLGSAMGASPQTCVVFSGMGDLVLTCTGYFSRYYVVGVQLGQGKKLSDILAQMRMVAEGVTTAQAAVALGERYAVEMPIAEQVHAVLQGHVTPHAAVTALMQRTLKHEGS